MLVFLVLSFLFLLLSFFVTFLPNFSFVIYFGLSITEHVNGGLMSRENRTVVNASSSGADLDDIRQTAEDFHHENLLSIHKIDEIIVSVGTNDELYIVQPHSAEYV